MLYAIDDALGLGNQVGGESYKEIVNRVKAIDAKRDKEFAKNVDIQKMAAEIKADATAAEYEDETTMAQAQRRRSSLIEAC